MHRKDVYVVEFVEGGDELEQALKDLPKSAGVHLTFVLRLPSGSPQTTASLLDKRRQLELQCRSQSTLVQTHACTQ